MPSPLAPEKAARNAWEVRAATYRSLESRGDARNGIEYVSNDQAVVVSSRMFRDKETALANACALLRAGYFVSRVAGPEFEMDHVALAVLEQCATGECRNRSHPFP